MKFALQLLSHCIVCLHASQQELQTLNQEQPTIPKSPEAPHVSDCSPVSSEPSYQPEAEKLEELLENFDKQVKKIESALEAIEKESEVVSVAWLNTASEGAEPELFSTKSAVASSYFF